MTPDNFVGQLGGEYYLWYSEKFEMRPLLCYVFGSGQKHSREGTGMRTTPEIF